MTDKENGSVQGMIALILIIVVGSFVWIILSPMFDRFMNISNLVPSLPLSLERFNAIAFTVTVWWLWPLIILAFAGLYYWKEAIMKRSGEV